MVIKNRYEPWLASLLIALCFASCSKVETTEGAFGAPIAVIGHGGMGFSSTDNSLPANSMKSLLRAIEGYNVDGVETDVQMSADSVLFLYHDQRLSSISYCIGCVAEREAAKLDDCRYRNDISNNVFGEEHLVRAEDFVARMALRQQRPIIILDVKNFFNCSDLDYELYQDRFARALNRLIRQYDGEDWIWVETSDLRFIERLNALNAGINLMFVAQWSEELLDQLKVHQLYGLSFEESGVEAEQVRRVQEAGWRVSLWNVGTRGALLRTVNKGPDLIYTDNVPLLQEILR